MMKHLPMTWISAETRTSEFRPAGVEPPGAPDPPKPRRLNAYRKKDAMTLLPPPADALVPAWQWLLAMWFGTGFVGPLRGGLAIAMAAVLVIALRKNALAAPVFGLLFLLAGAFVSTAIGNASRVKDDRRIVIDEVTAFVIGAAFFRTLRWMVLTPFASLVLFVNRTKPRPFHHLETLPAGWGVMVDDLGLGIVLGTFSLPR